MDNLSPRPRLSFKEQVQIRIMDNVDPETGRVRTSEGRFRSWLRSEGWEVRDQSVARTALSTFVEWRLFTEEGVYIKDDMLIIGRRGSSTPYEYELPYWMLRYITSFPKAPWRMRAPKLAAQAKAALKADA